MSCGYEAIARDVKVSLKIDKMITKAYNITKNSSVPFNKTDDGVTVSVGDVDNYAMVILEY
jgi:hypothetical protein